MKGSMRKLTAFCLTTLALIVHTGAAMAVEEPRFTTMKSSQAFSVRRYEQRIVAETEVDGTLSSASSVGFRRIAGYIFGKNKTASGNTTIAMTAPVSVEAPDGRWSDGATVTATNGSRWRIEFTMPSQYTLATLPTPADPLIKLRVIPPRTVAVLSFSGWTSADKTARKTAELRNWMTTQKLTATGAPELARYDPPWTLPFLRRNEILIPCE